MSDADASNVTGGAGPVRVAVELDREAEPIAGRLRRADGTTSEFIGWLELTQALEDAQRQAGGGPAGE